MPFVKPVIIILDCPRFVCEELRDLHGFHGGYLIDRETGEDIGLRRILDRRCDRRSLIGAIREWLPKILYEISKLNNAVCTIWLQHWSVSLIELIQTAISPERICHIIKARSTMRALAQFNSLGFGTKNHSLPVAITIRRVEVPDRLAYNGALLEFDDGYWLVYRANQHCSASVMLDRNLSQVEGTHCVLPITHSVDARLISCSRGIIMSTVWGPNGNDCIELRRIGLVASKSFSLEIIEELGRFEHIESFPGYRKACEKNWIPWEFKDELFITYSVQPHRILRFLGNGRVELAYSSSWNYLHLSRNFGRFMRLNAPPVRISEDFYLSTFHTSTRAGYFTWFYTFEACPPFRVSSISSQPVISPRHATGKNIRTGRQCIFVLSMIVNKAQDCILLAGGDNDHSVIVMTFSLWEILQDLVSVTSPHS